MVSVERVNLQAFEDFGEWAFAVGTVEAQLVRLCAFCEDILRVLFELMLEANVRTADFQLDGDAGFLLGMTDASKDRMLLAKNYLHLIFVWFITISFH